MKPRKKPKPLSARQEAKFKQLNLQVLAEVVSSLKLHEKLGRCTAVLFGRAVAILLEHAAEDRLWGEKTPVDAGRVQLQLHCQQSHGEIAELLGGTLGRKISFAGLHFMELLVPMDGLEDPVQILLAEQPITSIDQVAGLIDRPGHRVAAAIDVATDEISWISDLRKVSWLTGNYPTTTTRRRVKATLAERLGRDIAEYPEQLEEGGVLDTRFEDDCYVDPALRRASRVGLIDDVLYLEHGQVMNQREKDEALAAAEERRQREMLEAEEIIEAFQGFEPMAPTAQELEQEQDRQDRIAELEAEMAQLSLQLK